MRKLWALLHPARGGSQHKPVAYMPQAAASAATVANASG
jgi:hypothetical protein